MNPSCLHCRPTSRTSSSIFEPVEHGRDSYHALLKEQKRSKDQTPTERIKQDIGYNATRPCSPVELPVRLVALVMRRAPNIACARDEGICLTPRDLLHRRVVQHLLLRQTRFPEIVIVIRTQVQYPSPRPRFVEPQVRKRTISSPTSTAKSSPRAAQECAVGKQNIQDGRGNTHFRRGLSLGASTKWENKTTTVQ